jgi:hypothetical protein
MIGLVPWLIRTAGRGDIEYRIVVALVDALGAVPTEEARAFLAQVEGDPKQDSTLRATARVALGPGDRTERLLSLLRDRAAPAELRAGAARALSLHPIGEIERVAPALVAFLKDRAEPEPVPARSRSRSRSRLPDPDPDPDPEKRGRVAGTGTGTGTGRRRRPPGLLARGTRSARTPRSRRRAPRPVTVADLSSSHTAMSTPP